MKNLKFACPFLFTFILFSCLDTEEKIVLNANNSGTYSISFDLGRVLNMAAAMGADQSGTSRMMEKKDTTVYLTDLMDSAENLTASEKALYKDGMIHVKFDGEKNEMKIVLSSPFKNNADLTEIKNNFPSVMNKLKAFEKAAGEKEKDDEEGEDMKIGTRSANPVADQFTFLAGTGRISNTINNIDTFKQKVAMDSTLGVLSQMTSMMGEFHYRTIIVLPAAVKNYDGPGSTISADKKTITFFTTLSEMMEHPEKASYKIEY